METPKQCLKSNQVNNKDTRMTPLMSLWCFIVNFEQISRIVLVLELLSWKKRILAKQPLQIILNVNIFLIFDNWAKWFEIIPNSAFSVPLTDAMFHDFNLKTFFHETLQLNNGIKKNRIERTIFPIKKFASGFVWFFSLLTPIACRIVEYILVLNIKYLVFINM